ncbi:MAG: class I SAM-dependent methyltransferase [Sulfurovum sp.]
MHFTQESMQEIISTLQKKLENEDNISFEALNPDLASGYAGAEIIIDDKLYLYRGYKSWVDLAQILKCKMLTPKESNYPFIRFSFVKLNSNDSFHSNKKPKDRDEKYGKESHFWQINKMQEPSFLYYYTQALNNVKISQRTDILDLGVNRGDEFEVIANSMSSDEFDKLNLVGIDHSKTAIEYAQEKFKNNSNIEFFAHDINELETLNLNRFDLLISIGTLQSPSINFKPFLMSLVQNYLKKDNSALILGFPNSRWIDGEMVYGAKASNYAMSEMSLLYSDVIFCKKYLQQHKYRVTITGKEYIFLTATRIIITN